MKVLTAFILDFENENEVAGEVVFEDEAASVDEVASVDEEGARFEFDMAFDGFGVNSKGIGRRLAGFGRKAGGRLPG